MIRIRPVKKIPPLLLGTFCRFDAKIDHGKVPNNCVVYAKIYRS